MTAYQEGVKEYLEREYPNAPLLDTSVDIQFLFWRQLPAYSGDSDKQIRKHYADATNMQKALEDALQGVLITNDRNVHHIQSFIVEQDFETAPAIAIGISTDSHPGIDQWCDDMLAYLSKRDLRVESAPRHELPDDVENYF